MFGQKILKICLQLPDGELELTKTMLFPNYIAILRARMIYAKMYKILLRDVAIVVVEEEPNDELQEKCTKPKP